MKIKKKNESDLEKNKLIIIKKNAILSTNSDLLFSETIKNWSKTLDIAVPIKPCLEAMSKI